MKKIIRIAVCFVILLSCVLPVQASGGVPEKVMESTKSVVRILSKYYSGSATGSGFVIKNEPGEVLIATNDHVVSGNPYSISVWVGENELVDAEIVFTTSAKDLCVLRVTDPIDMKPLTLSTEDPQHGAAIYVVGYPGAGDILSDTQAHTSDSVTITDGIISAIRTFTIENGAAPVKLLQVNAAINSGNSGGPLFNTEGVVIGVNTYKVNANSQGVFGSVDISELWNLLEQHGIEIPTQQQVVIPEAKEFPVTTVAIAAGTVAALLVILLFVKTKKKKAKTLRKFMEAHPNGLGVSETVSMLLPVAIQLRNLHHNGKLHLQVSPDTILISADGATLKKPTVKENDRHSSGFSAPEIYKDSGYGAVSDIYSFSAVLYYMAIGKIPANSLQQEMLDAEFTTFEQAEPSFAAVIRKGMTFLSQDRTQSMQTLIYDISPFNAQIIEPVQQEEPKEEVQKDEEPAKTVKRGVPVTAVVGCSAIVALLLWNGYVQPEINVRNEAARLEETYNSAVSLMENGKYQEAIEGFLLLGDYRDSVAHMEACQIAMEAQQNEEAYQQATALMNAEEYGKAAIAFAKLDGYKDAGEKSLELWKQVPGRHTISMTGGISAILEDGTIITPGGVLDYQNVISLANNILLLYDGTVASYPNNSALGYVQDWTDIIAISGHWWCDAYMGLKSDGTVVLANTKPEIIQEVAEWTDIIAIANGSDFFLGLKSDGTVVAAGCNEAGQCEVSDWTNIKQIAVSLESGSYGASFGLKEDGTVVGAGSTYYGAVRKVKSWNNIKSLYNGPFGVRTNGTVIREMHSTYSNYGVGGWSDIVDITGHYDIQYGLKSDGTLVYTFTRDVPACKDWTGIQIP